MANGGQTSESGTGRMPGPPVSRPMPGPPVSRDLGGQPPAPVSRRMPGPPVSRDFGGPPVSRPMPGPPVMNGQSTPAPVAMGGQPQGMPGPQGQPFNVMDASAQGLQGAMATTTDGMNYQAPTLAGSDLSAYQNPYQQSVIDNTINDMDRSRQMVQNQNGAAASAAGAFGGSRHGLVESEADSNFMRQAGNLSAQLNQAGYDNAQQGAMFDINNNQQSQLMQQQAAAQLAGLSGQAFNTANTINQNTAKDGFMQQALMQQLMNAGQNQFQGFTGAPQDALNLPLAALGATPNVGTQTTTQEPGLFNFMSLGLGLL